jgi:hypothetical protein
MGGALVKDPLSEVIEQIAEEYKNQVLKNSRCYREISIGEQAERLGFTDLKVPYRDVFAIVPLKEPVDGMKVRIDGRTFVSYAQFESGVVVPAYVAQKTGLPFQPYAANDSMILNFA